MTKNEKLINDIIDDLLAYDAETGVITWRVSRRGTKGKGAVAGCRDESTGYWRIGINRKYYLTHRLAWRLYHGNWPSGDLDHINRNKCDNRITNLREATRHENNMNKGQYSNNTSGEPGVSWYKPSQQWRLLLTFDENSGLVHLGYYEDFDEAVAMKQLALKLFGQGHDWELVQLIIKEKRAT